MRPTLDRVLIKPSPPDEVTKGGLIIPEEAKSPPTQGQVIATGPGRRDEKIDCTEGDMVMFPEAAGYDFEYQEEVYKIIRWSDVIAVL